jgi:RNA 2',3'-cyclic 3'-phosphodiesterase
VRAFVAVFPPPEVRKKVLVSARRLLSAHRVRWTKQENIHLTLKFLGNNVREEDLESVRDALGEICAVHAPFDATLVELGAFPSARRAQILWAGVGAGSDRLRSLATDIDAALAPLGFAREKRPYVPHLTLGRVRGRPTSLNLPSCIEDLGFWIQSVELIESTLTTEGALYRTVESFALEGRS